MNINKGFTLVEILVALSIFAVVTIGVSGLMMSSLRVRQGSQKTLNAQQVAYSIIEHHKTHWSVRQNYQLVGSNTAAVLPAYGNASYINNVGADVASINLGYGCLDSDGTNRSNTTPPLKCSVNNPALRRVNVTITDAQGRVTANLTAEIGRPSAQRIGP